MMFGKRKKENRKNAPLSAEPKVKEKKAKSSKEGESKERKLSFSPARILASILDGSFLTRELVMRWLPFSLFLVLLAMIYIGNNYSAQRKIRAINKTNKEIIELRNEHISTKSELMFQSKISEVARKLETEGIKESKVPPKKIYIDEQDRKEDER